MCVMCPLYAYPTLGQHPPFRVLCGWHNPYCINRTHHYLPSPNCCEAHSRSSLDKKVSPRRLFFSSFPIDLLGCRERSRTPRTTNCIVHLQFFPLSLFIVISTLPSLNLTSSVRQPSGWVVDSDSYPLHHIFPSGLSNPPACSVQKPLTTKSRSSLVMR
jgi:hypothetical protein